MNQMTLKPRLKQLIRKVLCAVNGTSLRITIAWLGTPSMIWPMFILAPQDAGSEIIKIKTVSCVYKFKRDKATYICQAIRFFFKIMRSKLM